MQEKKDRLLEKLWITQGKTPFCQSSKFWTFFVFFHCLLWPQDVEQAHKLGRYDSYLRTLTTLPTD